jgi:hypothetical protein
MAGAGSGALITVGDGRKHFVIAYEMKYSPEVQIFQQILSCYFSPALYLMYGCLSPPRDIIECVFHTVC